MAVSKYQILSALVEAQARGDGGDPYGWHYLVLGVLDEISVSHGSEEELAEAIFERVAGALITDEGGEDGAGTREHPS